VSECDAIRGVRADHKKGFTNLKRNLTKKVTPSYLVQKVSYPRRKIAGCMTLKTRKFVCHTSTDRKYQMKPRLGRQKVVTLCFDKYDSWD
jgi:hypothetical protein